MSERRKRGHLVRDGSRRRRRRGSRRRQRHDSADERLPSAWRRVMVAGGSSMAQRWFGDVLELPTCLHEVKNASNGEGGEEHDDYSPARVARTETGEPRMEESSTAWRELPWRPEARRKAVEAGWSRCRPVEVCTGARGSARWSRREEAPGAAYTYWRRDTAGRCRGGWRCRIWHSKNRREASAMVAQPVVTIGGSRGGGRCSDGQNQGSTGLAMLRR